MSTRRSRWRRLLVIPTALLVSGFTVPLLMPFNVASGQEPIVMIVNPANPVTDLSLENLKRLYLGRSTRFPDGSAAVTLLTTPEVEESFFASALGMSGDRFKRHWIGVVFSGEAVVPPRAVGETAAVIAYVATNPNAIAFILQRNVTPAVKVLSVSGMNPSSSAYPLRVGAR